MPAALHLDASRSAVLSMDCQTAIVSIYTKGQEAFLTNAARALAEARGAGIAVIHVKVGFRPSLPEVSSRNMLLSAIKRSPQHQKLFEGSAGEIHPTLAATGDEPVVTKRRISAFTGTDLDLILRAKEIDTLVVFGIATSGAVLSTLLDAADADYRLVVIKDCCADLDPDVQTCLIDKIFPRCATVVSAAEFAEALRSVQRDS